MEKQYLVWDWNGTLLDDVPACIAVMDGMLARRGLPPLGGPERYRELFTFPVRDYYLGAGLDFSKEPFEALAAEYIGEYNERAKDCPLYPEAEAVLEELGALGLRQVVVSASQQETLREQVEHAGIAARFDALLGIPDSYGGGKEGVARRYFRERNAPPEAVLFVGDTVHDFEVARDMGCGCVLIAAGHQSRKRLEGTGAPVLDSLRELCGYGAARGFWKGEHA